MTDEKVKLSNSTIEQGYQALANAIVIQAAEDYRKAIRGFKIADMYAIRRFFHSKWYQTLTNVDGDFIINGIEREEIHAEDKRKQLLRKKVQRYEH